MIDALRTQAAGGDADGSATQMYLQALVLLSDQSTSSAVTSLTVRVAP